MEKTHEEHVEAETLPPLTGDEEGEEEEEEATKGKADKGTVATPQKPRKLASPQPTPDGLVLPDLHAFPALEAAMNHMTVEQLQKAAERDTPQATLLHCCHTFVTLLLHCCYTLLHPERQEEGELRAGASHDRGAEGQR